MVQPTTWLDFPYHLFGHGLQSFGRRLCSVVNGHNDAEGASAYLRRLKLLLSEGTNIFHLVNDGRGYHWGAVRNMTREDGFIMDDTAAGVRRANWSA